MTPQLRDRMVRRSGAPTQDPPLTASRAIGLCIARASQEVLGLTIAVDDIVEEDCDLGRVIDQLTDDHLMATVVREGKGIGLMACDADLVAAALEAFTTGRVSAAPRLARRVTNTDAALLRPWFTRMLQDMARVCEGTALDGWSTGCTAEARLENRRAAEFALPDVPFRVARLSLSDKVTDRALSLVVALPRQDVDVEAPPKGPDADWTDRLRGTVMEAPLALDAVLGRVTLSLARLTDLGVGDTVPLPIRGLGAVALTAADGTVVARGRLGQLDGQIAVRIALDPPEPVADLGDYPRPAPVRLTRVEEALTEQATQSVSKSA